MIKVSDITIEKLRNNQLQNELPEFFELKKCIENNSWHNNDSVFSHTLSVLEELKKLLRTVNNKINSYLNQQIDNYSRKDLLFLSTLFHDIAKTDTLIEENNLTSCPDHEEIGSEKVKDILERFDLSGKEKVIVIDTIKYHGKIHPILSLKNTNIEKQFADFKQRHHDIFIELILLGMSDTFGSQLKENNIEEYNFRRDFYRRIIDN
ncbi:MAG: HD domain-containing protein [Candidatus Falkowbacteria bacterium]